MLRLHQALGNLDAVIVTSKGLWENLDPPRTDGGGVGAVVLRRTRTQVTEHPALETDQTREGSGLAFLEMNTRRGGGGGGHSLPTSSLSPGPLYPLELQAPTSIFLSAHSSTPHWLLLTHSPPALEWGRVFPFLILAPFFPSPLFLFSI